jgi:DNA-binding transcriptional MocR family regulator
VEARAVRELRPVGTAGGLHLVLELPSGWPSEEKLVQLAARRGSLYSTRTRFGTPRPMILVGYAAPSDHTFEAGTRARVDLLAAVGPRRAT